MSRRTDATTLLERALIADATKAGVTITIDAATATRWVSATFVGARHRMTIAAAYSAAAEAWLGGLAEADLPLRGHLVADLVVADLVVVEQANADDRLTAIAEVLTVEEA